MSVRDTSIMAMAEIKKRIEPAESAVLAVIEEIGPACDTRLLEALNQKEQATLKLKYQKHKWTINSVTGRRYALVNKYDIVEDLGIYKKPNHHAVHMWRVRGDKRRLEDFGWVKVEKEDIVLPPTPRERFEMHQRGQQIKNEIGKQILGRLREYEQEGNRKTTRPTGQLLLYEA